MESEERGERRRESWDEREEKSEEGMNTRVNESSSEMRECCRGCEGIR